MIDRVQCPKPEIGRDLIVARAAGVKLARHRADFEVEQPLYQGVHVLVGRADGRAIGQPLANAIESLE